MIDIDYETLELAATYINCLPEIEKGFDVIILPREDGGILVVAPTIEQKDVDMSKFPSFELGNPTYEKQEIVRIIEILKGLL